MQQYHPNNIEQDPSRAMWNNSSELIKEKSNTNIFKKLIDENKKSKTELRDIVFNNNDRGTKIETDVIEKDKEIQALKFKLKQNEIDFNKLKKDLSIIDELKNENKLLNQKLRDEYERNKEISILKNNLERMKMENKLLKENKENNNTVDNDDDNDENIEEIEEIKTENYSYSEIFQKLMKEKEKYKNDKLKDIICKYKKDVDKSKIDTIFIEMKIDEKVEITKELITSIIIKLS